MKNKIVSMDLGEISTSQVGEETLRYLLPANPHVCWYVTERCNYTCGFCFRYREGATELNVHQALIVIENLARIGFSKLTFTGEPTLVDWIYDSIDHANRLGFFTTLMTNGSLIDLVGIRRLELSLDRLSLPLDGSTEEINLRMGRAPGHFDRVIDLSNKIIDSNVLLKVTTVVSALNWEDLPAIAEKVMEMGTVEWKVYQFRPNRGDAFLNAGTFEVNHHRFERSVEEVSEQIRGTGVEFSSVSNLDNYLDFFLIRPSGEIELATGDRYLQICNLLEATPSIFHKKHWEALQTIADQETSSSHYVK